MNATWLIAKHVSDLRRREPQNIGVMLFVPGNVLYRFIGQRSTGDIDGRIARFPTSLDTYKAWIKYWTRTAEALPDEQAIEHLVRVEPDQNYVLEYGGERVFGNEETDPGELLGSLYEMLVETSADELTVPSAPVLSERVLQRLNIADRVEKDFQLQIPPDANVRDSVIFDYRFDNGRPNLMRAVTLTYADKRSWDNVHSAAWDLRQAVDHPVSTDQRTISLVKKRSDDAALRQQLGLLESTADTLIDVEPEDEAAGQLGELLGVA